MNEELHGGCSKNLKGAAGNQELHGGWPNKLKEAAGKV
jgi:hypothetical protein